VSVDIVDFILVRCKTDESTIMAGVKLTD